MLVYSEEEVVWYIVGFFDNAEVVENLSADSKAEIIFVHRFESGQWIYGVDVVGLRSKNQAGELERWQRQGRK